MGSNRFRVDMPRYVDFYLSGRLKLDVLLSKHIKLEQVNDAMDALKKQRSRKKCHNLRYLSGKQNARIPLTPESISALNMHKFAFGKDVTLAVTVCSGVTY